MCIFLKRISQERRAFFLFLCLLLVATSLITIDYHGRGILGLLKDTGFLLIKPLHNTVLKVINYLHQYRQKIAENENILQMNQQLKQENQKLLYENNILREKLASYERIAKMLEFKEYYNYEMIPAQVIGREPSKWFHSVIIDMGRRDGVELDMGVATYKGLVGKIIKVGQHTSEVLLLIDQGCSVGALIQRSREVGVVKGSSGSFYCYLDYIAHDADIQNNDMVVTSGMGSSIPKGIIIGRVVAIKKEKNDLFQRILVKPEADFNKLEEVYLVKRLEYEH